MAKTEQGYLFIADITGYTLFLSTSELEHAHEVLQSLLELLIENTRVPLIISRLEGDAVISYALESSIIMGSSLLEMVDSCYIAFRRAIDLMVINTSCTCNACQNIPNLDLKFFVHYGSFVLHPLSTYTELIGTDVNLIHRLTKNNVKKQAGFQAYALFSEAAITRLGLHEWSSGMTAMTEEYDHIGPVNIFVQDMQPVWERERERSRIVVGPEDAIATLNHDFPIGQVHLWDYLIKPEFRSLLLGSDSASMENTHLGRIGEGAVYQCAHGKMIHPQTIVDWQPFEMHTILDEAGPGMTTYVTYHLIPTESGTRLQIRGGHVHLKNPIMQAIAGRIMAFMWQVMGSKGAAKLREQIERDLAEGKTAVDSQPVIQLEEIRGAIRDALAESVDDQDS